jgi:phosphoribulokinase
VVEGDSFHRYDRAEMKTLMAEDQKLPGGHLSHFGPEANLFGEIETLFRTYSETGSGRRRYYLHNAEEAETFGQEPGTFTPWAELPAESDLLFYEGLHAGVVTPEVDIAQYPDLLIGVVPVVNLEWIQKIHRDKAERGYSAEATVDTILRRMPDYVKYITPQFSRTHINFQRVATVDTSNPFIARDIPTPDESFVVIRFSKPKGVDFPYYLQMIPNSFMSRANTLVTPGGKMSHAMEIILAPVMHDMIENKKKQK